MRKWNEEKEIKNERSVRKKKDFKEKGVNMCVPFQ